MEKQNEIILTVFTPAYNRAKTLSRTYQSMCDQTCKDFIWLIVDDGSSDNTADLVNEWLQIDNGFKIRYIYKKNGGMHSAHNVAYANIETEINTCVDSDDAMPKDAVEKILNAWAKVKDKDYAGIIALDADLNTGKVIGEGFPEDLTETSVSGYYAAGGSGDKKLIYRTDIINSVPAYPEFEGEKYVSLSYKYLLLDQKYKMFVLNEIVCLVDYQQGGSTNNMLRQYRNNPNGWVFWRKVKMQYPTSTKRVIIDCIHYCSSCFLAHKKHKVNESPRKALTVFCLPLGWILSKYVISKTNADKSKTNEL